MTRLERLFAEDVVSYADGGGIVALLVYPLPVVNASRSLSLPSPRISGKGSHSRGLMRTGKHPFCCRAMVNHRPGID